MAERCRRNCAGRAPLPMAQPSTSPPERWGARWRGGLLDGEGLCVWSGELQFFALGIVAKPQLAGPQG